MRRLLLVGAGRAHLRVLRELAAPLVRGLEIVLLAEEAETWNPSMLGGLLRGVYAPEELRVDVAALAERAGARFVRGVAEQIALDEQVMIAGAERIPFDVCSLDADGEPEGWDLPGVPTHALSLRSAAGVPAVRAAIDARLAAADRSMDCVVVGGGAAGVEAAFALQGMLRGTRRGGVVTIVEERTDILHDAAECRDAARRALERAGVCFALGARPLEVRSDRIILASGGDLAADIVLWATEGRAPAVIVASGAPHDARGRLLVDDRLRARDGAPVYAAGTSAASEQGGLHDADDARGHGALLSRELRAALGGTPAGPSPVRGRSEPCLLDTGDGRALIRWGRVRAHARWAWWLKRRRDRRFVSELAGA